MNYRKLGKSNLEVSEVGFGVWTVGTTWWGAIEPAMQVRLLQDAFELGVNLYDTADTYSEGYGEEVLAKAMAPHRHDIIIATKFGYDFYSPQIREGHRERPQKFDPDFVRFACEQSLRRLKTDYIDLYQLHNPRIDAIERDDLFALLDDLVKEGKLRSYGAALGPDIGWFDEGDAAMKERPIASLQIINSILEQQPARRFFPTAAEHQVGLLARVPHASEALTEAFRRTPPTFGPDDHRSHRRQEWLEQAVVKVEQLGFLTEHHPIPLDQLAIGFSLAEPTISAVLPNITNLDDLRTYAAASDLERPCPECVERLADLFDNDFYVTQPVGAEGSPGASES